MTGSLHEGSPGRGGESAGVLALLTPGQERFAELMTSDPRTAFRSLLQKIGLMSADPERPGGKTTRIGETPVKIHVDSDTVIIGRKVMSLAIFMASGNLDSFMKLCWRERLSQDFIDALKRRESGEDFRLILFCDQNMNVDALAQSKRGNNYNRRASARVIPQVAAVLFDLLEPRGIGPDLEEGGEPAAAGAEPADGLVPLSAEEAELAESIRTNPEKAWERIEEILRPLVPRGITPQVRIGGTVVTIDRYWTGLDLSFDGEPAVLKQIMEACSGDGLSRDVEEMLTAGIEGHYGLRIAADFTGSDASLRATAWGVLEPVDVNPKFFAALMMRLEKFQGAESPARDEEVRGGGVQVYPLGEPAVAKPPAADRSPAWNKVDRGKREEIPTQAEPSLAYKGDRGRGDRGESRGLRESNLTGKELKEVEERIKRANAAASVEIALNKLRKEGVITGGTVVHEATGGQQQGPKSRFERIAGQKKKKEAAKKSGGKKGKGK